MSDAYLLLKVVHILSATVLFGTGLGTAVHLWLAHRSGNVAAIAVVARNVVLADFALTAPSGVVQPTTGIALAHLSGWPLLSPWLVAAYALYALAFACWAPVVVLQIRARDLAAEAGRRGESLPPAYHRIMCWWFALGWPAFLALIAIFALMVVKPDLW
ncbi:MAG TPA: DUF2269 domain-containing protein [Stellaceae bacterium]|nr:DUF2269 domain-containing protein [Stellaceae bacterium]